MTVEEKISVYEHEGIPFNLWDDETKNYFNQKKNKTRRRINNE